jgi:hypothetical protein
VVNAVKYVDYSFDSGRRCTDPCHGSRLCDFVAWEKHFALFAQVKNDSGGLEHHNVIVYERRELCERMNCAICRSRRLFATEHTRLVAETRFLQCPTHSDIADYPVRECTMEITSIERNHRRFLDSDNPSSSG